MQGTPDDNILSACILDAEATFEIETGTGFDSQTYTQVAALLPFVDGNQWIHLYARERGPVTAVTSLEIRDIAGGQTSWQHVTWASADDIILPPYAATDTHPRPESWHVQIWPTTRIWPRATGQMLARWTYTGGFPTIPASLQMVIAQYATFIYKLREAPIGRTVNMPLGSIVTPQDVPPYIRHAIHAWSPQYA